MLKPTPQADWPSSWRRAYDYDLIEVFGEATTARGHARAYQERVEKTLDLVGGLVPPNSRIIDIAAAQGNFSLRLAELGYQVTWNDLRDDLAGYVQLKYETGVMRYRPGNVFALPIDECYDAVLITEIIEHVAHPDEFLAQVARLLRPGGVVIMTTPSGEYFANRLPKFSQCADPSAFEVSQFQPDGDGHIFLLHRDEIEPLARRAGLEIISIDLFTLFLSAGRLHTQVLLKTTPELVAWLERSCASLPDTLSSRFFVQMAVCFKKALPAEGQPDTTPADGVTANV
ncbi:MAG: methyltransferase domain-containing protein [Pseudomonadota bacterium]